MLDRRTALPAALLLAISLSGAGCGGTTAKKATGSVKPAGSKAASSPTAAPAHLTATKPASTGGGDYCSAAKREAVGLKASIPKNFTDPGQLKVFGLATKAANSRLLAMAPSEIRGDLAVITKISDLIADSYITGTKPGVTVLKEAADPRFLAATKHLAAYGKSHCGFVASPNLFG